MPGAAPTTEGDDAVAEGTVRDVQYLGNECRVRVALDDDGQTTEMIASVPSDGLAGLDVGARASLVWPRTAAFHVAPSGLDRGGEE